MVPTGKAGKRFVLEKTRLLNALVKGCPLERIALKAFMVMEHLLLQRVPKSKAADNAKHLDRRLDLWEKGRIKDLMEEAATLQERLEGKSSKQEKHHAETARLFAKFVFEGRIHHALKFMDNKNGQGILPLTEETWTELKRKHPEGQKVDESLMIKGTPPEVNHIVFAELDGGMIQKAALDMQGSAGVSGGDAQHWRRLCCSFRQASAGLCEALAAFARRLCTEQIDPVVLEAFVCNRSLPLDKSPGLRPIGIGELIRRIVGKAVLRLLKKDISIAAGATQLCAGQEAGAEAIIHAMLEEYSEDTTEGILLVDADNGFNRLNRNMALHNIRFICPAFSTILLNCYRTPTKLYVQGGRVLYS